MKNKTVEEIVREYLAKNGYDGLYNNAADCACKLGNLFVCDQVGTECSAGYLQPVNGWWLPALPKRRLRQGRNKYALEGNRECNCPRSRS